MGYVVPREGGVTVMAETLSAGEDWLLCLYDGPIAPSETDTAATYTALEASFPGYARRTLSRRVGDGAWSPPVAQAPSGSPPWSPRARVAHSSYDHDNPQAFACTADPGGGASGYFVLGAESGALILAEPFAARAELLAGDSFAFVPIWESA